MNPPDDAPFVLDVDEEPEVPDPRDDVPAPDDKKKPKTPEEIAADNERLQRQVGQLTAERDIALEGLRRPAAPAAPAVPTAPAPPQDDGNRQRFEQWMDSIGQKHLMGQHKEALAETLQFVDAMVADKLSKANVPIATAGARQAVRNFTAQMRNDDLFPRVEERFTSLIEQALPGISQMPVDQQDGAIEAIYNIAIGQAARARQGNGRRETPPPYATGSPSSGARPAQRSRKLSAMQQQYVISAREAKIPEERIRVVLDEMDAQTV